VISRDEKPVGFVCVGASPFTGYQSHEPGRRILHDLGDTNRELTSLRERLHELGQSVE
jgi:hypothetical protein